jgi:hypothetical protein
MHAVHDCADADTAQDVRRLRFTRLHGLTFKPFQDPGEWRDSISWFAGVEPMIGLH